MEHQIIRNCWGPWGGAWGAPLSQKRTKACPKSSDIPLTVFHETNTQFPIVDLSHSAILYLDFSWNNRSSIWDHLGPWGGTLGAPPSQKTTKTYLESSDVPFLRTHTKFFHS